jgi:hypothetical protein
MISSGCYGVLLIIASWKTTAFEQIFSDFKVDVPLISRIVLAVSHVIWADYLWLLLLPLSILWPLAFAAFVPVPESAETRRNIKSAAIIVVILVYLTTVVTLIYALFGPMILMVQSVSGPQKH